MKIDKEGVIKAFLRVTPHKGHCSLHHWLRGYVYQSPYKKRKKITVNTRKKEMTVLRHNNTLHQHSLGIFEDVNSGKRNKDHSL